MFIILSLCFSAGQVRDLWCPVLYRVAVHHVATFIAQQPYTTIAQQLSARIQQLGNKVNTTIYVAYMFMSKIRVSSCLFYYFNKFWGRSEFG
jgi:hypothetical protein